MIKQLFFLTILFLPFTLLAKKPIYKEIGPKNIAVTDFCLTNDGKLIFISYSNRVDCYEIASNKFIETVFTNDTLTIDKMDYSVHDSVLVMVTKQGHVFINRLSNAETNWFKISNYKLSVIKSSSSINRIAVGTYEGELLIYDYAGNELDKIHLHDDIITDVSISNNGEFAVSSGMDGKIWLYNLTNTKTIQIASYKSAVRGVDINQESNRIIACSDRGKIYNWKVFNSTTVSLLDNSRISGWGTSACYGSNNCWAVCSLSGKIKIGGIMGGFYEANTSSILTKIAIIPENSLIKVIVLQYQKGLRLYSADKMELNTSF